MSKEKKPLPGLLSAPRITTLFASLLVALSSGSNYVYSAYAPQLGARLQISHTRLNIVGLAGNIGVYSSGPFWGRIVDTRGPRILLISAFIFLLIGYSGMRHIYDAGVPTSATTISTFTFCLLVACNYLTGAGGNGGLASSVNATARTFPDKARATTTGIVISGFGLSAFLFSTISNIAFAGNTSSFLLLLSVGTAVPMLLGLFLVRPIPLPPTDAVNALEDATDFSHDEDPENDGDRARLLDNDDLDNAHRQQGIAPDSRRLSRRTALREGLTPNVYGRKLWTSSDFWLIFSILSMLSGTGLMYINNVGSMSQALFAKDNPAYDPIEAARWQADQVSVISLMNFSGRICIGLISDFAKSKFDYPRSYLIVLVAFLVFISQVTAANIDNIRQLWMASALLGLGYGSVFSLLPQVIIEWFGILHFSENWGYLSLSPMFAGNLFSVAFGRNMDAHETPATESDLLAGNSSPQCLKGRLCYVEMLYVTMGACLLSMGLGVWAAWRDKRKLAAARPARYVSIS
ncbi:major facilitator superfamily domain-containing protein [Collybia nuda]|uniref:Major facilitator superfamily domain-containing protein n=1 Tax=Collybia nuda TaxID=64659 RepID=A0A9P6CCR3_9AGAR|nr:major facilitator superfamily domain-containing protein [Collybia nuda]